MKKVLNWCWKNIKKPLVQFGCILVLVAGYWMWDISIEHTNGVRVQTEVQQDTTSMKTVPMDSAELEYYEDYMPEALQLPPDSTETSREPTSIPDSVDEMSDREYIAYIIDMILGHLSEILGSIAALCTPIITWYYQRKKK